MGPVTRGSKARLPVDEREQTVLVADDDDGYRYPLVNALEDAGFRVTEASDKCQVAKRAKHAGIWIVDVRLPNEREGIAAVVELVRRGVLPRAPIFFLSVLPESFAQAELTALAAFGVSYEWIEKPIELDELVKFVRLHLDTRDVPRREASCGSSRPKKGS